MKQHNQLHYTRLKIVMSIVGKKGNDACIWTNMYGIKTSELTNIVMASAVLSLFNSSSIELSDEKDSVKFFN